MTESFFDFQKSEVRNAGKNAKLYDPVHGKRIRRLVQHGRGRSRCKKSKRSGRVKPLHPEMYFLFVRIWERHGTGAAGTEISDPKDRGQYQSGCASNQCGLRLSG